MALTEPEPLRIAEIPTDVEVDPVTLDIIEGALKNARFEMDAVLFRSAMSPVIREQHDEFPMITDPRGRMVVGQFGAYINEMMADWDRGVYPGDVILTSDPFKCSASISVWPACPAPSAKGRRRCPMQSNSRKPTFSTSVRSTAVST